MRVGYTLYVIPMILLLPADAEFSCDLSDNTDCSCVTIAASTSASTTTSSTTLLTETNATLFCTVTATTGSEVQWIKGSVALGVDPRILSKFSWESCTWRMHTTIILFTQANLGIRWIVSTIHFILQTSKSRIRTHTSVKWTRVHLRLTRKCQATLTYKSTVDLFLKTFSSFFNNSMRIFPQYCHQILLLLACLPMVRLM